MARGFSNGHHGFWSGFNGLWSGIHGLGAPGGLSPTPTPTPPPGGPALDFSEPANSMYVPLVLRNL